MTTPSDLKQEIYGGNLGADLRELVRRGAWRPLRRMAGIAAWTAGMLVVLLLGLWVTAPFRRARLNWRNAIVRRWARGLAWIVNMRIRVLGQRPKPPFFLVANHQSYVDIALILAELDAVFVAKHELGAWPVLGYLNRLVGTIFVDRQNRRDAVRVIQAIDARIAEGDAVVVFPEGTSSHGDDVYPMKPALFEWAAQAGFPVRYAAIRYRTFPGARPAREVVCWWGSMAFLPHVIELCQLDGFEAEVHFGPGPLTGGDRATLAAEARQAIATLLAQPPMSRLESP